MKVYTKLVIDIASDKVLESKSYEDHGPVALASGGSRKVSYGSPGYSPAGQMILGELRSPLGGALQQDIINDPFANLASRQMQQAQQQIRGGYGARGLAGSGIALKGEQDAIRDLTLQGQAARANQLTEVLKAGSASPSFPSGTAAQPRGFMGLK